MNELELWEELERINKKWNPPKKQGFAYALFLKLWRSGKATLAPSHAKTEAHHAPN